MIRIEEKAGHGAGKPTSKIVSGVYLLSGSIVGDVCLLQIDETADVYAFLAQTLGVTWTD